MEKLMKVVRLRLTDEMCTDIKRFMAWDDRDRFEETVRHLLRVGLKTKMGGQCNGSGVGSGEQAGWSGQERRKNGTR